MNEIGKKEYLVTRQSFMSYKSRISIVTLKIRVIENKLNINALEPMCEKTCDFKLMTL